MDFGSGDPPSPVALYDSNTFHEEKPHVRLSQHIVIISLPFKKNLKNLAQASLDLLQVQNSQSVLHC